jgi:hypothetical protein
MSRYRTHSTIQATHSHLSAHETESDNVFVSVQ